NVVRDPVRAGQGLGQGGLGIEGQDDDGNGHCCLPLASSDRAPARTSAYILSNSTATLDQSQRARTLALAASAILAWASASSSRPAAAAANRSASTGSATPAPSPTISRQMFTFLEITTGVPQAMASTTAMPKFSLAEGNRNSAASAK